MPTPVYLTINEFPGTGAAAPTVVDFNFAGGYISPAHVKAEIFNPVTYLRTPVTVTDDNFVTDYRLSLSVVVPTGSVLRVYRDTPKDQPLVDFTNGARIAENNLDLVAQQAVFVSAESADQIAATQVADVLQAVDAAALSAAAAQAGAAEAAASAALSQAAAQEGASIAGGFALAAAASAAASSASAATSAATSAAAGAAVRADLASTASGNGSAMMVHAYAEAPAFLKTQSEINNGGVVSIHRFLSSAEIAAAKAESNAFDLATKFNAAVNSGARSFILPVGTYFVGSTIRQNQNGGAINFFGENKYSSKIKALTGMTTPIIWVGNSNGHGNYRAVFDNFAIEGSGLAGNHALILHEAGNTTVNNLRINDADTAIYAPGMIGSRIRDCEIESSAYAIRLTRCSIGTPSSVDDLIVTAGPLGLAPNINTIDGNWIAVCGSGIRVEGGLCHVTGNTFQSVGDGPTKNIVELDNANESFDYGSGPIVYGNWFESGTYRAQVSVESTRAAVVRNNFFSGSDNFSECGVLANNADQVIIEQNSFRGAYTATPTEGRTVNAPIYVYTAYSLHYKVRDNYITNPTGRPYFDGESGPNLEKELNVVASCSALGFRNIAAGSFVVGTTYTIQSVGTTDFTAIGAASNTVGVAFTATGVGSGSGTANRLHELTNGYQVTDLARVSTGCYRCITSGKFNIENPGLAMYAPTVIGTVAAFVRVSGQAPGHVELTFTDATGAPVDPDGFSLIVYAQPIGQGA